MSGHIIDRLPLDRYVRDDLMTGLPPSLSASVANILLTRSPKHAWFAHPRLNPAWEREDSEAAEIGTIAHALLLERDVSRIHMVDAPDWRTKDAKAQRDAARRDGKVPVLAAKMVAVMNMAEAADVVIRASELGGEWASGRVEQTLVWQEDGAWCRCRPDWISHDGRVLVDYKTTGGNAEPDAWSRGMLLSNGYDLQAAFGLRAAEVLAKAGDATFVFLVQETDPPYACSLVGLDPQWREFAEQKRRRAVALWRECLDEHDDWPGYDPRIQYASPPEYAVYRWGERMVAVGSTEGTVDDL